MKVIWLAFILVTWNDGGQTHIPVESFYGYEDCREFVDRISYAYLTFSDTAGVADACLPEVRVPY